jgi:CRISPR-associated protein Csb1
LPLFELRTSIGERGLRLTSFDFPHRYADAYLRDSEIDGVRFDETEVGRELRHASANDVSAVYRWDPGSLVFGAWDSHRKGRQARFARVYRSEVIGLDPVVGVRMAGRMDPYNLTGTIDDKEKQEGDWKYVAGGEKVKGGRLSEIGHGNIAPVPAPAGVTIREGLRLGSISFAALARLRFDAESREAANAARAVLAALALVGDRLAFDRASLWLRSGCELVVLEDEVVWEQRGGGHESLSLTTDDAVELLTAAQQQAANAGLPMETATVEVSPIPSLQQAIEFAFTAAPSAEE